MILNARVLNIRKHKAIAFLDCYTGERDKQQFMIDKNLVTDNNIKCGDYIKVEGEITTNKNGNLIFLAHSILDISKATDWEHYKGINNKTNDVKQEILFNARNAGEQLLILEYKKRVLEKIKNILNNDNFEDMTSLLNVVERQKNGSRVIDAEIKNRKSNEPRFLRITLENQLKQACAILLKSVYSIDKAFRNMGEDNGHINEFLLFELVSIDYKIEDMINFILKMDNVAREEHKLLFDTNKNFIDKLEIVDFTNYKKRGEGLEEIKSKLNNVLITNYPAFSPLIKTDNNGNQTETRWYLNGRYTGHFYEDENDFSLIENLVDKQNDENNVEDEDINRLEYFTWGLPSTISFGISIDRWLQQSLNEDNINKVANPLGLDYSKIRRR